MGVILRALIQGRGPKNLSAWANGEIRSLP